MPKPSNLRTRPVPWAVLKGIVTGTYNPTGSTTVLGGPSSISVSGKQSTVSEGHHWPHPKTDMVRDQGGDFYTTKSYVSAPSKPRYISVSQTNGLWTYRFTGHILPVSPLSAMPPTSESSTQALNALGATAIARCAPGNPGADVATAIGELHKEGLPGLIGSRLWKKRTAYLKSLAEEYLNVQFGWKPLVSDVHSVAHNVSKTDAILTQYERDSGNTIRRRFTFPQQRTVVESLFASNVYPFLSGVGTGSLSNYISAGDVIRRRETVKNQWFSGAFTYYLPSGYDSRNALTRAASRSNVLLGLSLTPEVLWNLTPWSWAADWFSNSGDVIHNVTRFGSNGLVMRYGYIMEHTIVSDTYTHKPYTSTGLTVRVPPLVLVTETKKRRKANPYGFGVSWSGLSPFQLSIAAALGISR